MPSVNPLSSQHQPATTNQAASTASSSKYDSQSWEARALGGGETRYKLEYTNKEGETIKLEQTWSDSVDREFIIGSMMALADLYENATPEVRGLMKKSAEAGLQPYFVRMSAPKQNPNQLNATDSPIGFVIAWPNEDQSKPHYIIKKDENGNYFKQELRSKPNEQDFNSEAAEHFNDEYRFFKTNFYRANNFAVNLISKFGKSPLEKKEPQKPHSAFTTAPNDYTGPSTGLTKDGNTGNQVTINEKIKAIAESINKVTSQVQAIRQDSVTVAPAVTVQSPTVSKLEGGGG